MKLKAWLLVVAIGLLISLGLGTYKYRQISAAIARAEAFPEPAETVELATVRENIWQPSITVSAELVAVLEVALTIELPGRIVEVGFAPGETVEAGRLLVQLDTREEEALLKAAAAEARLAQLALDRNRSLASSGAASVEARDQATARRASALAQVEQLRAIIDKKSLRAPFDARAGLHQLAIGQYLDAGTELTRLVGVGAGNWIDFKLPQQQSGLAIGDEIAVTAPRLLTTGFGATVIARDAWVDRQSRQLRFRAAPMEGSPDLPPGAMVTVTAPLGPARPVVSIPPTALRRDTYGAHVFALVAEEPGGAERARRRAVTVALEREDGVIILEGLTAGERIAGDGAFKLRDGSLVRAARPTGGSPAS